MKGERNMDQNVKFGVVLNMTKELAENLANYLIEWPFLRCSKIGFADSYLIVHAWHDKAGGFHKFYIPHTSVQFIVEHTEPETKTTAKTKESIGFRLGMKQKSGVNSISQK
jgi:hypothetical protein